MPDVVAVAGSVSTNAGIAVDSATVSIDAFRGTLSSSQFVGNFTARTDVSGRFASGIVLGPLGVTQCLLRITVTPPAGAGLASKTDSAIAVANKGWPPLDTARVAFVLGP